VAPPASRCGSREAAVTDHDLHCVRWSEVRVGLRATAAPTSAHGHQIVDLGDEVGGVRTGRSATRRCGDREPPLRGAVAGVRVAPHGRVVAVFTSSMNSGPPRLFNVKRLHRILFLGLARFDRPWPCARAAVGRRASPRRTRLCSPEKSIAIRHRRDRNCRRRRDLSSSPVMVGRSECR